MNPAMSVVEKRNFSLMHLVTGALGKQPEQDEMCQVHNDQMNRVTEFARTIRDFQQGITVDLSVVSTYSLHDMEFQADLSRSPIAQAAIIEELTRRD